MIKCIIFDLGNVVISVNQELMFCKFSENSGKTTAEIERIYSNSADRKRFEKGEINSISFYNSMKISMNLTMNFNDFKKIYTGMFSNNREIEKIIPKLKERYRLILLSNTDEIHYDFIKKNFPVLKNFDDYVLSYKSGKRKPNPLIFLEAVKKYKTMPWNCLYFDDITEFVIVARLLGIRAFKYEGVPKLKKNLNQFRVPV